MTVLRQKALNLLENIPDDYIEEVFHLLENFQFQIITIIHPNFFIYYLQELQNEKLIINIVFYITHRKNLHLRQFNDLSVK